MLSTCGKLPALHPTGNDGNSRSASRDHSDDQQKSLKPSVKDYQNANAVRCECICFHKVDRSVF